MQFETRFRQAIHDGEITLTFRRWKRPQALPGHRYRTSVGMREVDAVTIVSTNDITDADAMSSGYVSSHALIADLRGTPDFPVYRVVFHAVRGPDPRDVLAATSISAADLEDLRRRLDRLDAASAHGPWTLAVLRAIQANPALRATELAMPFGREVLAFKTDVRKLKNLGLTISLDTGYKLSPRGESLLRALEQQP